MQPTIHIREYPSGSKLAQFYCPGCKLLHVVGVVSAPAHPAPIWDWNQSLDRPTLSPSVLVTEFLGETPRGRCHTYVRDGQIEFLGDCTHDHAGKTVPLLAVEQWPEPIRSYTLG